MTSSDEVNITTTLTQVIPLQTDVAVFLSALNIFLAITASLGNALILNVLPKTSLHSPTKLLFGNLAVTDLCVGLISKPLFVTIRLSAVIKMDLENPVLPYEHCKCLRFHFVWSFHLHLWWSGISGVLLSLLTSFSVASIVGVIFVIISTVISIFCYTKIFMTLRQNETQVQNLGQQRRMGMSSNIGRYKKTVWSIAWVQLALIACYIPFIICAIVMKIKDSSGTTANTIWIFTFSLIYVNSSLNPILYCWRIKDARQEVKATIRRFCCRSS